MAAIRRPVRSRPIRVLLIGMFAVPLVSLIALWVLATVLTVPAAVSDQNYKTSSAVLSGPALQTLTVALPTERQQTYIWLLSGRKTSAAALLATRKTIDQVLPAVRSAYQTERPGLNPTAKAELDAMTTALGQLNSLRGSADSGKITAASAFAAYSKIVDDQFQYYESSVNDRGASLGAISVGATDVAYSLEMASREAALGAGALTVTRGTMSPAVRQLFISSAASRQQLLAEATALLPATLRGTYTGLMQSPVYLQFTALEQQIATAPDGRPLPVSATAWESASGAYLSTMAKAEFANGAQLQALSSAASNSLLTEAILAGGVGLAAVAVSVFLMLWFGRRVTRDLTRLHGSVRAMSEERLPRVVAQLSRGDDVDVAAESPPPAPSGIDEISQIARSFGVVQEAAVAAAVDQARLRKGVNQVFLNISMRNQSLLHRQLSMLDAMERRTSDPGALADLFRLDHLTTRMRRHAEGLIILSGSTPGRGWRDPVPVVDVLRAAVAEVEDYVRVDVVSESRDLVAGNAVNNVIHLIAELVENATVFSPPNTRIEIRADRAGTGVVAEIEDRGLGLSEEELADINRRLASPPEFDPSNSEQLGLFVVSSLAARHAIKVSLRQSVYGGTTAILLLPFGVIVRSAEAADGPEADTTAPLPSIGASGRHHRLAVTGRRADTGLSGAAAPPSAEWVPPPVPPSVPRPPWEQARPEPTPAAPAGRSGPPGSSAPAGQVAGRPPWDIDAPWSGAFSRSPLAGGPASPVSPAAGNPGASLPAAPRGAQAGGPAGGAAQGSHLGMPIRVPQANMAPQLQARRADGGQPAASRRPVADERPPEDTRNMMILMQQGWERGRIDDLDDPAGAPGHGTER